MREGRRGDVRMEDGGWRRGGFIESRRAMEAGGRREALRVVGVHRSGGGRPEGHQRGVRRSGWRSRRKERRT
jgi:hypothetical protein